MLSIRKVMKLPLTGYLVEADMQLFEQENFVASTIETLKEKILEDPIEAPLPQIYKNGKKGGQVEKIADIFDTVKSLIEASYGEVEEENYIFLGIFNLSNNFFKFGKCTIKEDTPRYVEFEVGENKFQYEEGNNSVFNGFIVSAYGEVFGTENFLED